MCICTQFKLSVYIGSAPSWFNYRPVTRKLHCNREWGYYRRIDQNGFARKEHNLHCDVYVTAENKHIAAVWVARLVLDHAIAAVQTSR